MVSNTNPAYPNGKCAKCGFGLNEVKLCTNEACSYVIELRDLMQEVEYNDVLVVRSEARIDSLTKSIRILKNQNKILKSRMIDILNINKGQ